MKPELKKKIITYNQAVARDREAAEDFRRLLSYIPPGQVNNLMKDATCSEILMKYGIESKV